MSLLLAAIGATVAALLEVTIAAYAVFGDAFLHPVLVLTVAWSVAAGLQGGATVAFVGGLVLDALTGRPFGTTVLALLLVAGAASVVAQPLLRLRPVAAVILTPILSFAASALILALSSAVLAKASGSVDPFATFGPGALLDGGLALIVGPLAVALRDRTLAAERIDW